MKDNLITISTIMLNERLKFTFAELFLMNPTTLLAVSHLLVDSDALNINKQFALDNKQHNSTRRFVPAAGFIEKYAALY